MIYYECYHINKSCNFSTKLNYIFNDMEHQALVTFVAVCVTMTTPINDNTKSSNCQGGLIVHHTWVCIRCNQVLGGKISYWNSEFWTLSLLFKLEVASPSKELSSSCWSKWGTETKGELALRTRLPSSIIGSLHVSNSSTIVILVV